MRRGGENAGRHCSGGFAPTDVRAAPATTAAAAFDAGFACQDLRGVCLSPLLLLLLPLMLAVGLFLSCLHGLALLHMCMAAQVQCSTGVLPSMLVCDPAWVLASTQVMLHHVLVCPLHTILAGVEAMLYSAGALGTRTKRSANGCAATVPLGSQSHSLNACSLLSRVMSVWSGRQWPKLAAFCAFPPPGLRTGGCGVASLAARFDCAKAGWRGNIGGDKYVP